MALPRGPPQAVCGSARPLLTAGQEAPGAGEEGGPAPAGPPEAGEAPAGPPAARLARHAAAERTRPSAGPPGPARPARPRWVLLPGRAAQPPGAAPAPSLTAPVSPCADSFGCRSLFRKASDPSCLAASMEFIPGPPPRTPRGARRPEPPPQGPGGGGLAPREDPPAPLPPAPPPGSPRPPHAPLHPTRASLAHEESGPPREGGVGPGAGAPQPLGSPGCGKSRGRFPMMGIGQMLRKRHQSQQPPPDRPPEASLPALPPAAPASLPFDTAQPVQGQC